MTAGIETHQKSKKADSAAKARYGVDKAYPLTSNLTEDPCNFFSTVPIFNKLLS
jgi:hypothetical protein